MNAEYERRFAKLEEEVAQLKDRASRTFDTALLIHNRQVVVVDYLGLQDTLVDMGLSKNLKGGK